MSGHSRSKNGVASLAYVPGIPMDVARLCRRYRDGRNKSGADFARLIVIARSEATKQSKAASTERVALDCFGPAGLAMTEQGRHAHSRSKNGVASLAYGKQGIQ